MCFQICWQNFLDCGDFSIVLKDSDPRLSKTLTLAEFNVAFGGFRDTICEVHPQGEAWHLFSYNLALSYGGYLFYEYHKTFSAKGAIYIQKFNQRLDWSVVNLPLISRHFTGHKILACSICSSFFHTTSFCPRTTLQEQSTTKSQPQLKNAVQMIKWAGVGAWRRKADIADAFKVMLLHPSQWHLFSVKWCSKFYFCVKLTFGCRSSPRIFNTLSKALCWILYNDDSLFIWILQSSNAKYQSHASRDFISHLMPKCSIPEPSQESFHSAAPTLKGVSSRQW